jgi:hypothetical protein
MSITTDMHTYNSPLVQALFLGMLILAEDTPTVEYVRA